MTTVVSRRFRSCPARDAHDTWLTIVDLLTRGVDDDRKRELLPVSGVAASLIADQTPKGEAIVVTCAGPRTRIYCIYDEDALDDSESSEQPLGYNPLAGDWRVSLPCTADDLAWVRSALAKLSTRVTARGPGDSIAGEQAEAGRSLGTFDIDTKGFMGT